jgi:carbamoyl-phosphate synthase large subunit
MRDNSGNTCNVLISSVGRRVVLVDLFRQALAALDVTGSVLGADASRLSAGFQLVDGSFVVPPCRDPAFVPQMLQLCRDLDVRLIVPTIDPELDPYAHHREEFEAAGTVVAVSSPDVVEIGSDKRLTHEWLIREGFPTVRQASVADVLDHPEDWPFPVVAKPRFGSAAIGVALVDSPEHLSVLTQGSEYIVQAVASGVEHTVDVLVNRSGHPLCAVPRLRLEVRGGEVSKGMTIRNADIQSLASDVCTALPGASGVITIQVFHDATTNALTVIEINPRFGGGFPLAWEAGARYPQWMIEELLGLPSTVVADGWRDGLVMLRYDEAVFVDRGDAGL